MSGDALTHGGAMRIKQRQWYGMFGPVRHKRPLRLVTERELHRLLPDFECQHGRLEGDRTEPCGCYPSERACGSEGWPACGRCGDLSYPGTLRCEGCGGRL